MRRATFLAAVSLLGLSASASAATLPFQLRTSGVTVTREPSGSYLIALTARAYRPLAGRRVQIACFNSAHRLPAAAPPRTYDTQLRAPRRPAPFRVHPAPGVDACLLATSDSLHPLAAALSGRARRVFAEAQAGLRASIGLTVVLGSARGRTTWPQLSQVSQKLRPYLAGVQYVTDGRHRAAFSAPVAGGGRVSIRLDGDVVTTNLGGFVGSYASNGAAPALQLPAGPVPPAGTPLPTTSVPGVTATLQGRDLAIAFDGSSTAGAAYAHLAGHAVQISCTPPPRTALGLLTGRFAANVETRAPSAQPTTLHARLFGPAPALCSLGLGGGTAPLVQVALSPEGAAALEDGRVSLAMQAVAVRAAGDGLSSYASVASLQRSLAGGVAALSSPSDTPNDRRIGVYSDGARHLTVVARTLTGRRLFADFDGDVVSTNLGSVIDLLQLV